MKRDRILLFIPMYNCEKQICRVLDQLDDRIRPYLSEVIIVNNRSTDDGERAVADCLGQKPLDIPVSLLRNKENYGLGGSHKVAFRYAVENGFDYIIVLHGDDQGHIADLLPYLRDKKYRKRDCFLGARFKKGASLEGYSRFRTFGNKVYNILFSLVLRHKIYDLGSGLNMYSTAMLKDGFYLKYKDDLKFNYCMILGSAYHGHKMYFFPIRWSEDDQVSNVKMVRQAMEVLRLLGAYLVDRKGFVEREHRDDLSFRYEAEVVCRYGYGETDR